MEVKLLSVQSRLCMCLLNSLMIIEKGQFIVVKLRIFGHYPGADSLDLTGTEMKSWDQK